MPELVISAKSWATGVKTISGLDHLEGKTINVLTDGTFNNGAYTIASGAINLPIDYCYVTVGILKESILDTVPLFEGSQLGTAVTKFSRCPYVGILVDHTQGITIGDLTNQTEVFPRNALTPMNEPEELKTMSKRISIGNEWTENSTIRIKQSKPLQANILSVVQYTDTEEL
jgi:uncharacterized protein with ACT and thioredoxin-like domain